MRATHAVLLSFFAWGVACSSSTPTDDDTDVDTDETDETDAADAGVQGWVFSDFGFHYPASATTVGGSNLDGVTSVASDGGPCAHDDFSGPAGAGIDHQLFRVITDIGEGLDEGEIVDGVMEAAVKTGSFTVVVRLGGVEDLTTDDSVTVELFESDDVPPLGSTGVLPGGTLTAGGSLTAAPVTGTITDGVLTAGPFAFTMPLTIQIVTAELVLTDAVLRLDVTDGDATSGTLTGFWEVEDILDILGRPLQENGENPDDPSLPGAAGFALDDFTASLQTHADGGEVGGSCTSISTVFAVSAAQAFVVDP